MKNIIKNNTRSDYLVSINNNKLIFKNNSTKPKHDQQVYSSMPTPSDYYSTKLEKFHPNKREATALCPFHKEKNPSFSVNLNTGQFICFSCGARGNMITFQSKLYNQSYQEAIAHLHGGVI